jgi:hypothetical protein
VVPKPQVTSVIGAQGLGSTFEARIVITACLLVGNYNIVDHNAYEGLHHGRLNRVFELAGVFCQPRPEPIVRKRKVAALVPPPQKTSKNRGVRECRPIQGTRPPPRNWRWLGL